MDGRDTADVDYASSGTDKTLVGMKGFRASGTGFARQGYGPIVTGPKGASSCTLCRMVRRSLPAPGLMRIRL